jgi:hypothetical protein
LTENASTASSIHTAARLFAGSESQ